MTHPDGSQRSGDAEPTGSGDNPKGGNRPTRTDPQWVAIDERKELIVVDAPHPSVIDVETLLRDCQLRTQRRSGPGGQHRNKTDSGVFLTHLPTGVVGEATEKRSQAENRKVAVQRLRFRLAISHRTPGIFDASHGSASNAIEQAVRDLHVGSRPRMNDTNDAKPGLLALLLNDLHAAAGQPSLVAKTWRISTSALTAFLKSHAASINLVNQIRSHHGRPPLR